jgi:hypothetical protein
MHRSALIPSSESQLLTRLPGGDLDQVSTDGWAVFVRSAKHAWMLFPEEVAYEEDDPVRDVERIAIKPVALEQVTSAREDVGRGLGRVERICIARTLFAFRPGRPVGSTELQLGRRKVEIPPGIRHDVVEIAPQRLAGMLVTSPELRDLHFMPVDVGLVLETGNHRVLIRTHGFFADPFLDPAPDSRHLVECDLLPLDATRKS